MSDRSLAEVVDLIIRGFAHLERGIHPVDEDEVGGVRYLHWPDTGRRGGRFTDEFFALDLEPGVVIAAVREVGPGPDHLISDIHAVRGTAVEGYAAGGYVTNYREPVMEFDLESLTLTAPAEYPVQDVTTLACAERIRVAQVEANASPRLTSQQQIDDPRTLIKLITIDGEPACTGKGILIEDALYVTEIATLPTYRKRGLAEVLMNALHADARDAGAQLSVLTATAMAAPLYARFGYREIAVMDIYEPVPQRTELVTP